jgi:hypothetical protein
MPSRVPKPHRALKLQPRSWASPSVATIRGSPAAWPARPVLRIHELAREPLLKALGVLALGEAVDLEADAIAVEVVPAVAVREALLRDEAMDRPIVVAGALVRSTPGTELF